ncbi:serine carboxypeptidase-like [Dorcoceras hygrometricum]|uniref:Carboxypeptidase n=1 Tax=Dorcoceras hygrometricum TaxID=472368 RepID=A0A2Z7A9M0_9LAMI|nr:serine carboxypeptidase-like [Dorcoceras hygrometricum]
MLTGKMASTLHLYHCFVPLVSLFLVSAIFSCARRATGNGFLDPKSSKEEAHNSLVSSLNLPPKHGVGEDTEYTFEGRSRIAEKKFKFPFILNSGDQPDPDWAHHTGYYKLQHGKDSRMFYYFFESRNNSRRDPVVLWLTGGPGCSGAVPLFYENGPFHITDNLSLTWNEFGWDKVSNLLYVDQPIGTGFSYYSDPADIRHNAEGVIDDLFDFLQEFFMLHPLLMGNKLILAGESYGGHYIPKLATRIRQANKNKEGIFLNLKGLVIEGGMVWPEIQYQSYPDYALNMSLITKADHDMLNASVAKCGNEAKLCGPDGGAKCKDAYVTCNSIFHKILELHRGLNYYDIRKECQGPMCYDFSNMERYMNLKSVKTALGVGDRQFVSCSTTVYEAMTMDFMRNAEVDLPPILDDIWSVLVFVGEHDLINNWLGISRWTEATVWSFQKEFVSSPTAPLTIFGIKVGLQKGIGSFGVVRMYNSGHFVAMDQPKYTLEMMRSWLAETY